jgi:hypothetical protein
MVWPLTRLSMGTAMVLAPPAPWVSACLDAVDQAIREPRPHHGLSALPRAWLACGVTAVLVTTSMCGARLARARLGTSSRAAVSWLLRHRKMPWDALVVASVRVIRRHEGLTCGSLGIDDRAHKRSTSAHTLAYLDTLRDHASGGSLWGPSRVLLLVVTPDLTLPVGFAVSPPAPELSAWYPQAKALTPPEVPPKPRPPTPPPHPYYPTTHALARRRFGPFTAAHPTCRVHCSTAKARSGTATCVAGAAALCGGVPVISPRRSHQTGRWQTRDQHVADSCATPPGTPPPIRIRGGEAVVALVGRARVSVCSHHTTRFIMAITSAEEATSRDRMAADLTWRTRARVPGHTRRWRVAVLVPDGKSPAGWSPLTTQPGDEGARHSVILRLLVDHGLF